MKTFLEFMENIGTNQYFMIESARMNNVITRAIGVDPRQGRDGVSHCDKIQTASGTWDVCFVDDDVQNIDTARNTNDQTENFSNQVQQWLGTLDSDEIADETLERFRHITNNLQFDEKSFARQFAMSLRATLLEKWQESQQINPRLVVILSRLLTAQISYFDIADRRTNRVGNLHLIFKKLVGDALNHWSQGGISRRMDVKDKLPDQAAPNGDYKQKVEYCKGVFQNSITGLASFGLRKANRVPVIFRFSKNGRRGGEAQRTGRYNYVELWPMFTNEKQDRMLTIHELIHVMYSNLPTFRQTNNNHDLRKDILQMAYQSMDAGQLPDRYASPMYRHDTSVGWSIPHLTGEEWLTTLLSNMIVYPEKFGPAYNKVAARLKQILSNATYHGYNNNYDALKQHIPAQTFDRVKGNVTGSWDQYVRSQPVTNPGLPIPYKVHV